LLIGSLRNIAFPQPAVEIVIAFSILLAAINIWRPVFRGREAWVAGAFGLVHGMAFSGLISQYVSQPWNRLPAVMGFNIGIELIQLLLVLLLAPMILALASTRLFRPFRMLAANGCAVAALIWVGQRSMGG
jgi:hydrogenase/urease accessory protein HupE